jgi:hypothetical protein
MPAERSLAPREHGAYAELAFPLATGLLAGGPSVAGIAFAVAATAGFLLVEPLVVLAGARGARLRRDLADRARARALLLVLAGLAAALVAMLTAPPPARIAALLPAGLAAVLAPSVARGRHKHAAGELLVAAALASMVLPIGLAGGMRPAAAGLAAAIWLATFWLATVTVHAIKTRFKPALGEGWTLRAAPALAVGVVGAALLGLAAGRIPLPLALAVIPAAGVAAAALLWPVTPRHLRRVGWSLVAANLATFTLLLLA